ncbi:hypothetical protein [Granulosicoccus antarcticus]|uniref:Uncharacterized protein n=1 Tax=Granulosicoccus antarcticus IMCC3135 TaxID=1192854 RepID=A0A2Z2NTJ6_9GAMM|nr:hypothetical protein [Granulosicoccus antarcticus]ASJ73371.1 hypothetical protein IMCC3135_16445 [Granulosicoccus antarcticus IMCC3135]
MNQPQDIATLSSHRTPIDTVPMGASFVSTLRRYFSVIAGGNLVWEFAHMPLYTLWNTGTTGEIVFAAVHCTGGDVLIAMSALMLSLLMFGAGWPLTRSAVYRVVGFTMVIGVGYTVFSEWLNIVVREAWAYSELMPIVPVIDAGLSPLLQWIVIPGLAFAWALRPFRQPRAK